MLLVSRWQECRIALSPRLLDFAFGAFIAFGALAVVAVFAFALAFVRRAVSLAFLATCTRIASSDY